MQRKDFLRGLGVVGLGSVLPWQKNAVVKAAETNTAQLVDGCVLIPQETAGPYPLDLSKDSSKFRQDIREGNAGTPLNLTLTIVNTNNNCAPVSNARVDIWHCNKDGYYSAFGNQPGYLGTQSHVGETFFRGIQLSDNNGEVHFTTIYPGWYPGRVTHIHFQVFLNSVLSATSQLAFPEDINTTVYNTALYDAHGQNPTKNTTDGVFADSANTQYQIATTVADGSGGYNSSLTVGIAAPATGLIELEPETGGQFKLGANYPNPFSSETTISFRLAVASNVSIELYDLQGRKLADVANSAMAAGEQSVVLKRDVGGTALPRGSYVYQFTVENANGVFKQCRLITVQ